MKRLSKIDEAEGLATKITLQVYETLLRHDGIENLLSVCHNDISRNFRRWEETMYFDDFKEGMELEIASCTINKDKMLAFAREYDNVPLHTDEEYAKGTHFKRLLAPGVMSFLEVWAKYLEVDMFGEELIAGKSTKIEWFRPVFADDVLSSKAVVTKLTRRNDRNGIVELTIYADNQEGECVLKSVTEAIVKCKNG